MTSFERTMQIRWSDLDPNFHLRHSVYYDWGALCRMECLESFGLTTPVLQQLQVGPILFREECIFRREVRFGDGITINLELIKARKDFSRWSFQHKIVKNGTETAAVLTVDGAWMNIVARKLSTPPEQVFAAFDMIPKSAEFEWL